MTDYIIRDGILYPAARCPICTGLCYPANTLDEHVAWHAATVKYNSLSIWERRVLGLIEHSPRSGIEKHEGINRRKHGEKQPWHTRKSKLATEAA